MNSTHLKFLYVQLALVLAVAACATVNGPYTHSGAAASREADKSAARQTILQGLQAVSYQFYRGDVGSFQSGRT